jgi:hypothetical protein
MVFSSNNSPKAPDTLVKAFFEYGFEIAKKIDYEIADFCHSDDTVVLVIAVSITPLCILQWCQ